MNDLISRQKVLEYLNHLVVNVGRCNGKGIFTRILSDYVEYVKNLPTIEPRANGHWIKDNRPGVVLPFMCSECEQRVVWRSKFCPGCGADMREVEHDSNLHAE